MAEQSAKGDCYGLNIIRNHVSRDKGKGWVNASGNKSTIRGYLRGKRV
jgi:hypothetical protein